MLESLILRRAFNLIKDPVIVSDERDLVQFVNKSHSEITGWKTEEIKEKNTNLFYTLLDSDLNWQKNSKLIRELSEGKPVVANLHKKDGTKLTLNATIFCIFDPEDQNYCLFRGIIFHPLLQNKQKETQDDFVSTISHELRTPLTSIKGFADTIIRSGDKLSEENKSKFLKIIKDQADLVTRIVEDLLFISRLDNHQIHLIVRPVDIKRLVDKVCETVSQQAGGRVFVYDFSEDIKDAKVYADSDRLEQVLINLITNAIKYSPDNSCIKIKTRPFENNPEKLKISIVDQGVGIPEEQRNLIFNRFSRLDNPLSRQVQGTGLGLYITRSLLLCMDGDVWLERSDESGSTFSFTLRTAP